MHSFLIALQFLTRIPVGYNFIADDRQLGYSVLYYPAIGLMIGGLLSAFAASIAGSSAMVIAAIILTAWVLLTGALHLDGLADCADAWIGGLGDSQRSVRIMKDPASGPVAVTILVLTLLLKWTALVTLIEQARYAPLFIAPLLGRSAILLLMLSTPYVSLKGLGEKLLQNLPRSAALWVAGLSLVLGLAVVGPLPLAISALLLIWIRRAALLRLGGATGDVYGAAVELVEAGVLVGAALQ